MDKTFYSKLINLLKQKDYVKAAKLVNDFLDFDINIIGLDNYESRIEEENFVRPNPTDDEFKLWPFKAHVVIDKMLKSGNEKPFADYCINFYKKYDVQSYDLATAWNEKFTQSEIETANLHYEKEKQSSPSTKPISKKDDKLIADFFDMIALIADAKEANKLINTIKDIAEFEYGIKYYLPYNMNYYLNKLITSEFVRRNKDDTEFKYTPYNAKAIYKRQDFKNNPKPYSDYCVAYYKKYDEESYNFAIEWNKAFTQKEIDAINEIYKRELEDDENN